MAREIWSGRLGFILATAGFAIGLGNIWRFPYLVGTEGGGLFVLVYLILAVLVGVPLITAEIGMGRKAQATPIVGMRRLTGRIGPWSLIGWLGPITAFLVISYYFMVLGWVLAYAVKTGAGQFVGAAPAQISADYTGFIGNTGQVLLYSVAVMALTAWVVSRGLRRGIEAVSRWLMPILFLALIALAIGSLSLPGAWAGVAWYLTPDWSQLNARMVLSALGQLFFSVGIGMAASFVYGSYLDPEASDVPGGAATVVAFDTLAALLAGFVIFPAVFAFGLAPDSGPGLLFVTMTTVFAQAPWGRFAGAGFFALVFVAGFTSVIAVLEALTATVHETWGLSRRSALLGMLVASFLVGLPSVLSFGAWSGVRLFGKDPYSLVDWVANAVLLPVGGLLIVLFAAYGWGFAAFQRETNQGAGRIRIGSAWRPFMRVVIPVAVVAVLLGSLGLLG